MSALRVLLISDLYPPIIGGLEQHVRNLARALAGRGHQVSVATLWHEGSPRLEVDEGVTVHRLQGWAQRLERAFDDADRRYAAPLPDPGIVTALARLVRRERPQVVHAHNWLVHSYLPLKRATDAPLIVSLHDYSLVCAKKSLVYGAGVCSGPAPAKCVRCAAGHYGPLKGPTIAVANAAMTLAERRLVDLYIPVSGAVARGNRLTEQRLPFQVIPNFIPDDVASRPVAEHPIFEQLPSEPFLLFVGALGYHKGVPVLLEAYRRMASPPPLVLIGATWPDTPSSFPAGVVVLRDVAHAGVMAAMARSIATLVPSTYPDACPTVAMEAMAWGRPVIASRIGGLPDLVDDGRTGFLVAPGDVGELAAAMDRLVVDGELRASFGGAGLEKVKAYKASAVVGRIEAAYRERCRSGPRPS